MLKICETCANSAWRDGKSAVTEVCLVCTFGTDRLPTNWKLKPVTNADRIRAMSDEDLVDLFRYRGCPPDRLTGKCVKVGVCEACWVDWLKQPAEEVDG